jgi:hypothetical protein
MSITMQEEKTNGKTQRGYLLNLLCMRLTVPTPWNRRLKNASRAESVGEDADTALRLIFDQLAYSALSVLKHFLFPGPINPAFGAEYTPLQNFLNCEGVLGCPFGVLWQDSPLFFLGEAIQLVAITMNTTYNISN